MVRAKVVPISLDLLHDILSDGERFKHSFIRIKGVPLDAEIIGSFTEKTIGYIIFQHDSFDPVPTGKELPEVMPVVHKISIDPAFHEMIDLMYELDAINEFNLLDNNEKVTMLLNKLEAT